MRYVAWALAFEFALATGSGATAAGNACSVAVDVGHNVNQPGAISARGIPEFRFNQALAKALQAVLVEKHCRVALINEAGDIGGLRERTAKADDARLFVSIHHDSVQPQYLEAWEFEGKGLRFSDRFAGFSLFVSRDNPFPAQSLRCASAIGAALKSRGHVPSDYHTEAIPGENRPFADRRNGVHYYDELVVLNSANQAAVLIEAGVIVNRESETMLALPATREEIARAVAEGISACLSDRPTMK